MLSFKISVKSHCAFDENFVRCAHYRVCNANSPAAVELFARNGTQTEPRTRTNGAYFKTFHSTGARKSWKISEFYKNWKLSLRSLYNFGVQVPLVERKSFFSSDKHYSNRIPDFLFSKNFASVHWQRALKNAFCRKFS